MTAGQHPLVAFYDANGKPIKLAEATSIVVSSVSAANYLNLPAAGGGVSVGDAAPGEIYVRNYNTSAPSGIPLGNTSGYLNVKFEDGEPVYAWENPPGQVYGTNPPTDPGVWTRGAIEAIASGEAVAQIIAIPDNPNTGVGLWAGSAIEVLAEAVTDANIAAIPQNPEQGSGYGVWSYEGISAIAESAVAGGGTPIPENPVNAAVDGTWQRSGSGLDTYYINKSTLIPNKNRVLVSVGPSDVGIIAAPGSTGTFLSYSATDSFGWVTNPVTTHVAEADPHTQYLKESVADQANKILYSTGPSAISVTVAAATTGTYFSYTGTNTFGWVANPVTAHVADSDPHTQYVLKTGSNPGQILYRNSTGATSSVVVAAGDNGKYLKYNSATSSYTWDSPTQSNAFSKSITIVNPSSNENVCMFYADSSATVTKMVAVIKGDSSPSCTWTIKKDSSRTGGGTEVVTNGTVTNSITTGSVVTSFNSATIPSGSFVWLETTAISGTVRELHVTIIMQ